MPFAISAWPSHRAIPRSSVCSATVTTEASPAEKSDGTDLKSAAISE
jgi:hypothetical protein